MPGPEVSDYDAEARGRAWCRTPAFHAAKRSRVGAVDRVERPDEVVLVELGGGEAQREVVAVTEGARRGVAGVGELADPVADRGTDRLGGLPRLTALVAVVGVAQDVRDGVVVDLGAVEHGSVRVERRVDRRLEAHDPLAELLGHLLGQHAVAQDAELTVHVVGMAVADLVECGEDLGVGERATQGEVGRDALGLVRLGDVGARSPPGPFAARSSGASRAVIVSRSARGSAIRAVYERRIGSPRPPAPHPRGPGMTTTTWRFGAFAPQGWKTELAGIDGAAAQWQRCLDTALDRRGARLRLDLGLRPLPQRADARPRSGVRVLDDDGGARAGHVHDPARADGELHLVPATDAHREDHQLDRRHLRWSPRLGCRRRLVRARVPRLRLRLPAARGADRDAARGGRDREDDVDRARRVLRRSPLPGGRRAV